MLRRLFTAALALALLSCAGVGTPAAPGERPNVCFVFIDQLRADVLGCYPGNGNIATPHMDKLATQGTLFANAISSTPLCTPYRGMLQTGRYPTHTGIMVNWTESNPKQRGIAHTFREAGYKTAFIGKWHLAAGRLKMAGMHTPGRGKEIDRLVAEYCKKNPETEYVPPGGARMGYEHWEAYNFHCAFNNYFYYRDTPERLHGDGYETDVIFNQGMKFMKEQQAAGRPFLVMLAPHPPHPPFNRGACPAGYYEQMPEPGDIKYNPNVPKDMDWCGKDYMRCYLAMCKNADDNVGRLMKFLDETGLAKNTIVVVTSDHGDMLGSHGRHNKMVPYNEAMNIPLILRWPGRIPAGRRVETVHTALDYFPTLCGLSGVPAPGDLDGSDLTDAVLNRRDIDRDGVLIANYTSHWDYFDSGTIWPEWRGVRTRRYTFCKWLKGGEELYDNEKDPYQMTNLAKDPKFGPLVGKLRERMRELLEKAHDDFLPGTEYAKWFDGERNLLRTALGPVQ